MLYLSSLRHYVSKINSKYENYSEFYGTIPGLVVADAKLLTEMTTTKVHNFQDRRVQFMI